MIRKLHTYKEHAVEKVSIIIRGAFIELISLVDLIAFIMLV